MRSDIGHSLLAPGMQNQGLQYPALYAMNQSLRDGCYVSRYFPGPCCVDPGNTGVVPFLWTKNCWIIFSTLVQVSLLDIGMKKSYSWNQIDFNTEGLRSRRGEVSHYCNWVLFQRCLSRRPPELQNTRQNLLMQKKRSCSRTVPVFSGCIIPGAVVSHTEHYGEVISKASYLH